VFETFDIAPSDPILGLNEAFAADPNPRKINLGVGVYKDASGKTPVLDCVVEAQKRMLASQTSMSYLGISGSNQYAEVVGQLMFGPKHPVVVERRAATAHTPGGTGALRVAADFLHKMLPKSKVWISAPTWPNHPSIFAVAGVATETYPYFNAATNGLDFDALLAAIEKMPAGDVLLLHGCCHNPTGVDPSPDQWKQIAAAVARRRLLPLLDFAYQGFGQGLSEDAAGLRELCEATGEVLVCSSFSKNFGLYSQRVGAMTVVAADADAAMRAMGHVKMCIRSNYSNPPEHGGALDATILSDEALTRQWHHELTAMRERIASMRRLFVAGLAQRGAGRDFSFIARQNGMFSFSGLTKDEVERLRREDSIYIVGSGRINVAGMTEENMPAICDAVARVVAQ
jgi:aspartate/tyrosine/aromatic aminotransferase